jgi:DNA-binding PadR family transcriptional regulator
MIVTDLRPPEVGMKEPWFHILVVVAEGPAHGAAIQRRVSEQTDGEVRLYPVTLYRSLDELSGRGLIEETASPEPEQHNEKRRYYLITLAGREALAAEAEALEAAARMAQTVLKTESAR